MADERNPEIVNEPRQYTATQNFNDVEVDGADEAIDGSFPGWGSSNSTSVGPEGSNRTVSVSFNIAADTDSDANIQCQVEDDIGTMKTVLEWGVPAGVITTAITVSGSLDVPRGRSY